VFADFNGDHKLDLAVTNIGSNDVSILLGEGDGTFVAVESVSVGMGPLGIAVGDSNHDGNPDLAVANTGIAAAQQGTTHNTMILLGTARGFRPHPSFGGEEAADRGGGDFNNDKKVDLAVSNNGKGDVSELLGKATAPSRRHACSGAGAASLAWPTSMGTATKTR
jgi:hypothetical protein